MQAVRSVGPLRGYVAQSSLFCSASGYSAISNICYQEIATVESDYQVKTSEKTVVICSVEISNSVIDICSVEL
jgi:uncharacterized surface protein with fasciclin (FAS1) repeats